ncbi:hypothetical protein CJ030_MR5G025126 [Morella rubra]|uniref:Uncharacterized protein n=1 Tax=Morella rubra TaxID=262757 RepID=A0A6A1VKK5_9ROSI|nr:hypothetical protein CJ030_MR5G025126 [Morella rubra]
MPGEKPCKTGAKMSGETGKSRVHVCPGSQVTRIVTPRCIRRDCFNRGHNADVVPAEVHTPRSFQLSVKNAQKRPASPAKSSHPQPGSPVHEPVSKRTKSQVAQSSSCLYKGKEKQRDASPDNVPASKFLNAEAESHYTKKFRTKGVILEREVLLDELTHLRFSDKIVSRGWEGLLTKLIPSSEEVHLNVVGTQGASSMAGGVEDPDRSDSPLDDEDDELFASAATTHSLSEADDSA